MSLRDGVVCVGSHGSLIVSRLLGPWRLLIKAQGRATQLDVLEVLDQQQPARRRAGWGRIIPSRSRPDQEVLPDIHNL